MSSLVQCKYFYLRKMLLRAPALHFRSPLEKWHTVISFQIVACHCSFYRKTCFTVIQYPIFMSLKHPGTQSESPLTTNIRVFCSITTFHWTPVGPVYQLSPQYHRKQLLMKHVSWTKVLKEITDLLVEKFWQSIQVFALDFSQ